MEKENRVLTFIWIVLGSLAALMVVGVMISMNKSEHQLNTSCDELVKEIKEGKDFVPLPKRCEKGE